MKITRINRIRNHRIFSDFSWPDELPDFACFNVIYGWNGAGKTTLSNLFLHLQKKLPITEGEVEFRFGQNNVSGANLSSSALPSVKVFNRDFVSASFFEAPGQQFSPIYYLDEESVETKKKIEELKSQRDEASKQLAATFSKKQRAENALDTFSIAQAKIIKEALSVTTTPLPHATGAHGQLPGRDFNPLDLLLLLRTVGFGLSLSEFLDITYVTCVYLAHESHLHRIASIRAASAGLSERREFPCISKNADG